MCRNTFRYFKINSAENYCDSSVSRVARLRDRRPGFDFRQVKRPLSMVALWFVTPCLVAGYQRFREMNLSRWRRYVPMKRLYY
jgi:hypothetical protein